MEKAKILKQTEAYVEQKLGNDGSGHDWEHIKRVRNLALRIAKEEGPADIFVIELAALLHDIADWKFHDGDDTAGPRVAREWLEQQGVQEESIVHVCDIIQHISFKGASVPTPMNTKEGMVVQDADRLDAIGAIGIARTFAYGGRKGEKMYDPALKPKKHSTFEEYKTSQETSINHFSEKLLLLKDRMHTETAKRLAEGRHQFLEHFLAQFFKEWDGKA